jgi:hypothetical protein
MISSRHSVQEVRRSEGSPSDAIAKHAMSADNFRKLGYCLLALAIPSALVGFSLNDALQLAISAGLLGSAFVAFDASRAGLVGLTPITLYAFTWTLTSLANTIAILNQNTAARSTYFLYAIDEHLALAMKMSWLGLVIPVLSFQWVARSPSWYGLRSMLPVVRGEIREGQILTVTVAMALVGFTSTFFGALPSLGTLSAIIQLFPHLAAFTLARLGVMRKQRTFIWVAFTIAVAEATRAALFAYLRSDVLAPIFAYAAGVILGGQSLRQLRSVYMAPVLAFVVIFVAFFAAFGDVRSSTGGGLERLTVVAEARASQIEAGEASKQSLVTRLTNINQLTQVARVVKEDGFLGGKTLEYMAYAFIPRFLWPGKPKIAKGAWFALRIGQARIFRGQITNSINMTIPGEFYLNFGWMGLLFGSFAYGAFVAVLWNATEFWQQPRNVVGGAFGFYLIWVGVTGVADLQIVVTLSAMYLLFAGVSFFLRPAAMLSTRVSRSIADSGGTS